MILKLHFIKYITEKSNKNCDENNFLDKTPYFRGNGPYKIR